MAKAPKKIGRPAFEFDQAIGDEICTRIAKGESLRSITSAERDDFMPSETTVLKWLRGSPEFAGQYAHARELQAEHFVDEIVELADKTHAIVMGEDGEQSLMPLDHNRARLQIDARKWVASKLVPKKYGDKTLLGSDPDNPLPAGFTVNLVRGREKVE